VVVVAIVVVVVDVVVADVDELEDELDVGAVVSPVVADVLLVSLPQAAATNMKTATATRTRFDMISLWVFPSECIPRVAHSYVAVESASASDPPLGPAVRTCSHKVAETGGFHRVTERYDGGSETAVPARLRAQAATSRHETGRTLIRSVWVRVSAHSAAIDVILVDRGFLPSRQH
jgi:hypothetical protein